MLPYLKLFSFYHFLWEAFLFELLVSFATGINAQLFPVCDTLFPPGLLLSLGQGLHNLKALGLANQGRTVPY